MKFRLLKTAKDYHQAMERIEQIFDAEPGDANYDELELLSLLIKDYEDKHFPIAPPDPIEVIKLRLLEQGLKNKDLIPIIGSESHVSSVLSGRRQITLEMARSLSSFLHIPSYIFINEHHHLDHYISEKEYTMNLFIEEELERSKARILRLKDLSMKLKAQNLNIIEEPRVKYADDNSKSPLEIIDDLYHALINKVKPPEETR